MCGDIKGHLNFSSIRSSHLRGAGITMNELIRRLRACIGRRAAPLGEATDLIETLVATILSQNTSDVNSHRAYRELRATYDDWHQVADADIDELARVIRAGGLAGQKARAIREALRTIRARYPDFTLGSLARRSDDAILTDLTAIPGVGLKTAACVLMFSLKRDVCAVDTHIHRIANRLGIVHTSSPDKTFHALRPLIPKGKGRRLHIDLILFGRNICKARSPHCHECPLYDLCAWEEKERHGRDRRRGPRPVSGDLLLTDIIRGNRP